MPNLARAESRIVVADWQRPFPFNHAPDVLDLGPHLVRTQSAEGSHCILRDASHPNYWKMDCREGDIWSPDLSSPLATRNRTEVGSLSDPELYGWGVDVWTSYAFRPSFTDIDATWTIFGQWHATEDTIEGTPELATNPVWKIEVGTDRRMTVKTAGSDQNPMVTHSVPVLRYDGDPIVSGRWEHIVTRCVFAKTLGAASCQVWRNGALVVDLTGIDMGYNDEKGLYWKFGIYRLANGVLPMVAEFANVEWGYDDLSSRILAPLPTP